MKKINSIITVFIILITIAGCQKAPESQIVVGKDMERMIEKAKAENPVYFMQQVNAPQNYSSDTVKGKLSIKTNAEVILPNAKNIPIIRVHARDFTQDEVYKLFQALCGDTTMYVKQDQMTKKEIEELIITVKQNIEQIKNSNAQDKLSIVEYNEKEYIPKLEKLYKTAPDIVEKITTEGILYPLQHTDYYGNAVSNYTGLYAYEDKNLNNGKEFVVANNSDQQKEVSWYMDWDNFETSGLLRGATLYYSLPQGRGYFNEPEPIPDDAEKKVGITPDKAVQMVNDFINNNGMPFKISDVQYREEQTAGTCCYYVTCVQTVGGIECASRGGAAIVEEDGYENVWIYELLDFYINNRGIIFMSWNSPLEIRETLVDNCSLLPFSEIENIFQKMMIMINEPTAKQSYTDSLQFSIDFIKLELIRVIERNSIENGLLIPVWQFYGTKDLKWTQGAPPIHEYSCLLTINAVDGSIIDLSKGY